MRRSARPAMPRSMSKPLVGSGTLLAVYDQVPAEEKLAVALTALLARSPIAVDDEAVPAYV